MAKQRTGGSGSLWRDRHLDLFDAAYSLQNGTASNRRFDRFSTDVDEPDDLGARSHHGQPTGGGADATEVGILTQGPLHVLIDSTGLGVFGTGQWLEAKHGAKSHRTWRKLHLAVDVDSGMIVAQALTDQQTETAIGVAVLNRMLAAGRPNSVRCKREAA